METSTRSYVGGEYSEEKGALMTYIIQIFDEPRQTLTFQSWKGLLILVPVEEVGELLMKLGRAFVEGTELL